MHASLAFFQEHCHLEKDIQDDDITYFLWNVKLHDIVISFESSGMRYFLLQKDGFWGGIHSSPRALAEELTDWRKVLQRIRKNHMQPMPEKNTRHAKKQKTDASEVEEAPGDLPFDESFSYFQNALSSQDTREKRATDFVKSRKVCKDEKIVMDMFDSRLQLFAFANGVYDMELHMFTPLPVNPDLYLRSRCKHSYTPMGPIVDTRAGIDLDEDMLFLWTTLQEVHADIENGVSQDFLTRCERIA